MKKLTIIYASYHHKNTKKVLEYVKSHYEGEVDLVDILVNKNPDLSESEYLVLASGIYYGTLHKRITEYIDHTDFSGKKVMIVYTCGIRFWDYASGIKRKLKAKNAEYLDSSYCIGYDTYGFLKKIGGMGKNRPNEKDCKKILSAIGEWVKN